MKSAGLVCGNSAIIIIIHCNINVLWMRSIFSKDVLVCGAVVCVFHGVLSFAEEYGDNLV